MATKLPTKLQRLTELFRICGAPDPEAWARSEVSEDIPQLARYLFLRGAWRSVIGDGDTSWIEAHRRPPQDPNAPLAGLSGALDRIMAKGIDPADLTEVVRGMQYGLLFSLCYLLDDPSAALEGIDDAPGELEHVNWGLFELDDDGGRVGRPIGGLHESCLETDPTGREMRPKREG